jgi:hypothetical protein
MKNQPITPVFQAMTWSDNMTATNHGTFESLMEAWRSFDHLYPVSSRIQDWGGDYSEISVIVNDEVVESFYFANPTDNHDDDRYFGFDLATSATVQVEELMFQL